MKQAVAAALLLGGCVVGTVSVPPGISPHRPLLVEDALIAEDGARLPMRLWLPETNVAATILAVHGFNDYSNAFAGPAAEWAKHGIATFAYDQRGFGAAPDNGRWVGTQRLGEDLVIASQLVARRYPTVPHYILGESMGGAVVIAAMTGTKDIPKPVADGIILSAPAVWGRDRMNIFERSALWVGDRVAPGMTLTGSGLHIQASDNIEMLRALGRDPLVIKATRVDTIKGLVDLMDEALAAAPYLRAPTLLLYGAHDEVIPPGPIRQFVAGLPKVGADECRLAYYANGYHMLLRDLEAPTVMTDIESWIGDRTAPLPSGADRDALGFLNPGS
jgi:alpha-beta hydrolase superfamily lysophospholipase